jgi:hypothetical protein
LGDIEYVDGKNRALMARIDSRPALAANSLTDDTHGIGMRTRMPRVATVRPIDGTQLDQVSGRSDRRPGHRRLAAVAMACADRRRA